MCVVLTLRVDEDYISFIESLKGPVNAEHVTLESLSEFPILRRWILTKHLLVASTQPVPQPKSTPLLEALKAEKSANKDKEAILRNHAHYSQIIPPASRKEDKKKATPASQASKASEGTSANVTNSVVGTGGKKSKKGQPHVQAPAPVVGLPKAATAATDSGSKNTADGPITESTKPVKAPRVPRVAPQNKNQSNNFNQGGTVDNATAAPSDAPARRRPVIGLGSRQFEAALSGVGGRERRPKSEKGKEKESLAQASNDGPSNEAAPGSSPIAVPPNRGAGVAGSDEVEPLPSPKKERTRRGRGGDGGGGGTPVKISGILRRVDTAPSPAIEQGAGEGSIDAGIDSTAVAATATTGVVVGGNRGGGRRGRGRGGHMKEKGVVSPTVKSGG